MRVAGRRLTQLSPGSLTMGATLTPQEEAMLMLSTLIAATTLVGGLTGPVSSPPPATDPPVAAFDHRRFGDPRANPYFPLVPGTRTILVGTDEGQRFREIVTVTHRHRRIAGVRTTVVRDVVRRADRTLAERTVDWYAADHRGMVWYFGERTATFDADGRLESREGTWRAGRQGARPGIVMPAHPHAGLAYRQEMLPGHAEDQAWVVSRGDRVSVPLGRFRHVVRTYEWSRLEPGVVSMKLYARGVGIARERDVAGGSEVFEVVSVSRPSAG